MDEDVGYKYLILIKFCQNPFSGCRGEVENTSTNLRGNGLVTIFFTDRPK